MSSISTAQPKVLFPAPPPTTNSLTMQQRNRLLRKTKKLEQLLGAAPHLLDNSNAPDCPSRGDSHGHKRRGSVTSRGSFESLSTASVASTHSSTSQLLSSLKRNSSTSSNGSFHRTLKKSPSSSFPPSQQSAPVYETWSGSQPPFLRINANPHNGIPYWGTTIAGPSKQYTLAPSTPDSEDSDDPDATVGPSFTISCSRRSKMDRLRRKLGHGVPIELVFPSSSSKDVEDDDAETSASSGDDWLLVPPTSRSCRSTKASGTIAGSRDSLIIHLVPCPSSSTPLSSPSSSVSSLGAPPHSPPDSNTRRLSAIVEGLDEPSAEEQSTEDPTPTTKAARRRWSFRP